MFCFVRETEHSNVAESEMMMDEGLGYAADPFPYSSLGLLAHILSYF